MRERHSGKFNVRNHGDTYGMSLWVRASEVAGKWAMSVPQRLYVIDCKSRCALEKSPEKDSEVVSVIVKLRHMEIPVMSYPLLGLLLMVLGLFGCRKSHTRNRTSR